MRLKKIIDNKPQGTNAIFTINFETVKRDTVTNTSIRQSYNITVPDIFAKMYCGDRKMNKVVKENFKDERPSQAQYQTWFTSILQSVIDTYKYKWGALMDSMTLYYNPLWNVDGTEEVTNVYAQRQTTDVNGAREDSTTYGQAVTQLAHGAQQETDSYGEQEVTDKYGAVTEQNSVGQRQLTDTMASRTDQDTYGTHTDSTQYGADITDETHAPTQTTELNKTYPFNDADSGYNKDKKITDTIQVVDQTNRHTRTDSNTVGAHTDSHSYGAHTDTHTDAAHTDTLTTQTHTDTHTADTHTDTHSTQQYTDTQTDNQHTDTHNTGSQTNTSTDAAHTDTVTTVRYGNIGVTKSTELLRDYVDLQKSVYEVVLRDIMGILSIGY